MHFCTFCKKEHFSWRENENVGQNPSKLGFDREPALRTAVKGSLPLGICFSLGRPNSRGKIG